MYKATAINDFIQGIVMLGGIIAVIVVVLNSQGGFAEAFNKMKEVTPTAHDFANPLYKDFQPGDFASWFGPSATSLLGVVVLTSLGMLHLGRRLHRGQHAYGQPHQPD